MLSRRMAALPKESETIQVKSFLRNRVETEQSGLMILALYDQHGVLIQSRVYPWRLDTFEEKGLSASIAMTDEASTLKAFIWGGDKTLAPLFHTSALKRL